MNIGTVVEGPTDRLVIEEVICAICPGDHRFFALQPESSDTFGQYGGGWKGVQKWCNQTWKRPSSSLGAILTEGSQEPLDLLVIQLDADIVLERDLQEGIANPIQELPAACPPPNGNAQAIRKIVSYWLNLADLPHQVIFAIPSQDTENWTFAALFPGDPLCQQADYECIQPSNRRDHHPSYCLTLDRYGKLTKRVGSTIKKPVRNYREAAVTVGREWSLVCRICEQAGEFHQAVLQQVGPCP